ncbi:hypothetical protein CNMCM5793_005240 [Aspergillus hiratsukae]|uniref:Uncharacterized protein n=1 Tax=Aspergillus hiratsukae TaxID=1194566 RepID=A0A8H6PGL3_9EURO|nr:hypothetical protein CNMCM5793_005240 [Aspergillus hiratsukae]KAF7171047.1 hypothetical protein CNMCM6106_005544 [Aspergillus hiratsukae]
MEAPLINSCLGIALPPCLGELPISPPVCLADSKDQQVFDAIRALGLRSKRPEEEIEKACCLASGPSDIMVLLERPAPSHDYAVDFAKFVRDCPTLQAVDELIRFASNGSRSIHTVSVVDAFLLKPRAAESLPTDSDCLNTVEQILKIKRPRVVICCWTGQCDNGYVSHFRSCGVGSLQMRSAIRHDGRDIIIIPSFHPATAVCYNTCRPSYRVVLAYHFTAAFLELHHPTQPPEWIREISKMAASDDRNEELSSKDAENILRSTLLEIIGITKRRMQFRTKPKASHVRRDDIPTLTSHLGDTSYRDGALLVARATLLWRYYFSHEPTFKKVLAQLLILGNRQTAFYHHPPESRTTGLEESLLLLTIHEPAKSLIGSSDGVEAVLKVIREGFDDTEIRDFRRRATDLSAQVQRNLQLPEIIACELRPGLQCEVQEFLNDYVGHLERTLGLINAMPAILAGAYGQYRGEEQPTRSIMEGASSRFILDQVIALSKARISQEQLCSILVCEIISRSQLIGLFSNGTDDNPHDWTTVLRETPSKLGQQLKSLRKGTDILHAMCAELAGAQGLLEPETPVIPRFGSTEDGGLVAVNPEILRSLRASDSPLLREDTVSDDPANILNPMQ